MKLVILLFISILTLSANSQTKELEETVNFQKNRGAKVDANSPLQTIYLNTTPPKKQPAYFIDGKYMDETIMKTIDPHSIDSMSVVKEEITIENKKHYGQIHIKLKEDNKPEFISLADLKTKYTQTGDTSYILMIDDYIVTSDYDKFIVNENYILRIEVQKIDNKQENLNVNVIRLITKTEANIKKANEIRIRGGETAMLK